MPNIKLFPYLRFMFPTPKNTAFTTYTFGSIMVSVSKGEYRYGFNGMEKDSELNGEGNSLDFGARIYDSRLGRWMSVDPLARKYENLSPFISMLNSPVVFRDIDGRDVDDSKLIKNNQYIRGYELFANTETGKKFLSRFYGGRENYINCTNTPKGDMSQHSLIIRPSQERYRVYKDGKWKSVGDNLAGAAGGTFWKLQMNDGNHKGLGNLTAKDIENSTLKLQVEIVAYIYNNLDDPLTFGHEAVLHVVHYIDRINEVVELYSKSKISSETAANRLNKIHSEMGKEGAADHDKATSGQSNKFKKSYDLYHSQLKELLKDNPSELKELDKYIDQEKKEVKDHAKENTKTAK
jgi:RHS repeat-associated protein